MNAEVKYFAKPYNFCKPIKTPKTSVLRKLLLQMWSQTVLSSSLQALLLEYFLVFSVHADQVARLTAKE